MARSSVRISLGAKRCTLGSGRGRKLVGEKLRRGQQVAQIVIDLGDREAERGEPALLMQHGGELALHGGELFFRPPDFVAASRFADDARRIFRVGAERDHVAGDARHRPHQQIMQREEHQRRADAGDHQRKDQDVGGDAPHRLGQRRRVQHDLEELTLHHRRRSDQTDDVARLGEQQRVERLHDGGPPFDVAHVDVLGDLRGHVVDRQQAPLVAHLDGHRVRADAVEDHLGEALRHHLLGRGVDHQRGGVRRRQPVVEPVQPEVRDPRHIDENFRHRDECDGEKQ